ncbi:MAG: hypothetical protein JRK53_13970 [Deltaproteobacteria bacterium]|nr:hypothetical protein [Deltaproteobacteria bacterium]
MQVTKRDSNHPRSKDVICFFAVCGLVFLSVILSLATPDIVRAESGGLIRGNPRIIKGIDLIYNNRLMEAEKLFSKMTVDYPEDPGGYFYLAMVTWSRLANGFWGPETVAEFKNRIDRAVRAARRRVERKSPKSFDYFYLGGALGFKARFELMQEEYLSSFFLAREAVGLLESCTRKDPENKDVLLGLGTFDYYTDQLSGILKFLTYWFIRKGSKEDGLRKLEIAADKAVYSASEAKSLLLHIYLFVEKNDARALSLAGELAEEFGDNTRYLYLEGVCCIRMGLESRYRDILKEFINKGSRENSHPSAMWWSRRSLYLEASYELFKGNPGSARKKLHAVLGRPDMENDPAMLAWPRIKLGISYDLEGRRAEAEKYYNRIIKMENASGAQFLAKRLLKNNLKKDDPFIGY